MPSTALQIGIHALKGTPLLLTADDRSRPMHVVGRTGSGKSKLLEWMIREDISAGRGLLLLDPHGDLYRSVLRWTIAERLDRRRLLLIDQNQLDRAVGLNYLDEPGMTADWIAGRARRDILADVERQRLKHPIDPEVVWRFVQGIQTFVSATWYDPNHALQRGSFV